MNRFLKKALTGTFVAGALALFGSTTVSAQIKPGGGAPVPPVGGGKPGTGPIKPGAPTPPMGGGGLPTLPGGGKPLVPPGTDKPVVPPSGTIPAVPKPGEGLPATPAVPHNPQSGPGVPWRPGPLDKGLNKGLGLPAGVTSQSMLNGLTNLNIGDLNLSNGTANIVTLNGATNSNEIQAMINAVHNNEAAAKIADQLTTKLVDMGILKQGQQVVGFQNGKIFVTSGTKAALGAAGNAGTPMADVNLPKALPAGVTTESMVKGLTNLNIGELNLTDIEKNTFFVNGALESNQLRTLTSAVQDNEAAAKVADQLTAKLIQQGVLQQGQQVVGFQDGKIFVSGVTKAATGAAGNVGTPMADAGANVGGTGNANVNVGSLLTGLKKLDLQGFTVQPANVVNVNDMLKEGQIKGLMEAINVNADARKVADQLTQQLMASGTIKEGQHVIGVIGDKVYITGEAK